MHTLIEALSYITHLLFCMVLELIWYLLVGYPNIHQNNEAKKSKHRQVLSFCTPQLASTETSRSTIGIVRSRDISNQATVWTPAYKKREVRCVSQHATRQQAEMLNLLHPKQLFLKCSEEVARRSGRRLFTAQSTVSIVQYRYTESPVLSAV